MSKTRKISKIRRLKKLNALIFTLLLTMVVTLTGCERSAQAAQTAAETAPTATPAPEPTPTAPAEETATPEPVETETAAPEAEVSDELQAIADQLHTAAMGITEAGETIYYGEGEDFGVLLFYDETSNQYLSFVGPVSVEDAFLTITDEEKGQTFTFEMQAAEGDKFLIDTGDSGQAIMARCEPIEVVKALDAIAANAVAADAELQELADAINFAGVGTTEEGQTIYYAETDDQVVLVFHNESTSEYAAFVGPATVEGNAITITDEAREMSFTFILEESGDGTALIDTGDFGMATITECRPIDVVNALGEVTTGSSSVN